MFYNLDLSPLFPFLVSLAITAISIPFTIKLARKYGLVDNPKLRPHPAHIQTRTVPRAGGIPVFIGVLASLLLFVPIDKHIVGIILSITVLLGMGLLDDFLKNFSPFPRLGIQFLAGLIVVLSGVGITFITNPLGGIINLDTINIPIHFFGEHHLLLIADIFALAWIVWMMNMVNWAKGVDGQMPSIVFVAGLTIGFLSLSLFQKGDPNQLPIALICFAVSGTALGFLIFNWHPAKIFPGQGASAIFGFMIAVLSILSGAKLATALLVLLVPSVDFFYTFFRRIITGNSPFFGDKKHLHHLLLQRGWSHQRITLFYISTCAILGLLSTSLSSGGKLFIVIGVGVVVLGFILWLYFFTEKLKNDD